MKKGNCQIWISVLMQRAQEITKQIMIWIFLIHVWSMVILPFTLPLFNQSFKWFKLITLCSKRKQYYHPPEVISPNTLEVACMYPQTSFKISSCNTIDSFIFCCNSHSSAKVTDSPPDNNENSLFLWPIYLVKVRFHHLSTKFITIVIDWSTCSYFDSL